MKYQLKYIATALLISISTLTASAQIDLGKLIKNAGQTINNIASKPEKFTVDQLVGTWAYSAPAIAFRGEDALSRIGGAAAATTIENKLKPYYDRIGAGKLTFTVNKDKSFTMSLGKIILKGTISTDTNGYLIFNFAAHEKIKLGKISCMATKSGSKLSLTFDATRIMQVAKKISEVSSNSSFQTINSILSKYDGMYVGAYMTKK